MKKIFLDFITFLLAIILSVIVYQVGNLFFEGKFWYFIGFVVFMMAISQDDKIKELLLK